MWDNSSIRCFIIFCNYKIFWWWIWCLIRLYLGQSFCLCLVLSFIGCSLIQFYSSFVSNILRYLIEAFSLIHCHICLGTLYLFELNNRLCWLSYLLILYFIHLSFLLSSFCSQLSSSGFKFGNLSFHLNLVSSEFFLFRSFSLYTSIWIDLNDRLCRWWSINFSLIRIIFINLRSSWDWRMNRSGNIRRNYRDA
jgi:hypothetical protein